MNDCAHAIQSRLPSSGVTDITVNEFKIRVGPNSEQRLTTVKKSVDHTDSMSICQKQRDQS